MPITVIFALTLRSSRTVTVPDPEAEVVAGGTSLPPPSVTFSPIIIEDMPPEDEPPIPMPEQPARVPMAAATAADKNSFLVRMFIRFSLFGPVGHPRDNRPGQ